ncbi:nucleoporin NUP188-like [Brevipalpus obovatus]|uniref:nucleoporin NUP188-like n=1 Tax=Brevipalpus obovatus TaxID=246614 RepID=UPI003D9F08FE
MSAVGRTSIGKIDSPKTDELDKISLDSLDKTILEKDIVAFLNKEFDRKYNPGVLIEDPDKFVSEYDLVKILRALSNQLYLTSDFDLPIVSVIADFLVLALRNPEMMKKENLEDWYRPSTSIVYALSEKCENMRINVMISLNNFLCHLLQTMHDLSDMSFKCKFMDWITPWASFFRFSLRLLEKKMPTITDEKDPHFKLVSLSLALFQHIIILSECNQTWFYAIRRHLILESMVSLLCTTIELHKGFPLSRSLLTSLILVSTVSGLADSLQSIQAVEQINEALQKSRDMPQESKKETFSWLEVFELTIKLATSLLITLRHQFASTAIDLLVKHYHEITTCFINIRNSPDASSIEEATHATSLLCNLTSFKHVWMSQDQSSYDKYVVEVSKTCNSLIAFALRPGLLQHFMNHPHLPKNQSKDPSSSSSLKPNTVPGLETHRPSKLRPLEGEHINLDVHQALFKLLSQMLLFLHNVNPNLSEVLTMVNFGIGMKSSQIEIGIGAPSIEANKAMSLGSFLSCISLCIRMYVKNEKSANASEPSLDQHSANKIIFTLETSLSMLISQALLTHYNPPSNINEREKQMLWDEIRAELNSMFSVITRYKRKSSSSNLGLSKNPGSSLMERPFIKMLLQLVELRSNK